MRFAVALSIALLALSACESGAVTGASCSTSSECRSPLACRLGRCRNECAASRDCPIGARCLLDPEGLGACSVESDDRCESGGAACPSGLTCLGGRCVNTCTSPSDCPADGECREAAGAGISFCFAPDREDAGAPADGGSLDAAALLDAVVVDVGAPCVGTGCETALDLCVGDEFACVVRADHHVLCFGANDAGQLGDGEPSGPRAHPAQPCMTYALDGTVDCSASPVTVLGQSDGAPLLADRVACASSTACAFAAGGQVYCWGYGGDDETGGAGNVARAISISGPPGDARSIGAGRSHFCASFGPSLEAWCWGQSVAGQFGLASPPGSPVARVPHWDGAELALGSRVTCALSAGTVTCAGQNRYGAAGPDGRYVPPDDTIQYSAIEVPLGMAATAIAAGDEFGCALVAQRPVCWGNNQTSSLGRATTPTSRCPDCDATPAEAAGTELFTRLWSEGFSTRVCARTAASQTYCWGTYPYEGCPAGLGCYVPEVVPELEGAQLVDVGLHSMCAILADGHVVCSGGNGFGQLGRGVVGTQRALEPDYVSVCLQDGC